MLTFIYYVKYLFCNGLKQHTTKNQVHVCIIIHFTDIYFHNENTKYRINLVVNKQEEVCFFLIDEPTTNNAFNCLILISCSDREFSERASIVSEHDFRLHNIPFVRQSRKSMNVCITVQTLLLLRKCLNWYSSFFIIECDNINI